MHLGAENAAGKVLLFLHADTHLPIHAGTEILEALNRDQIVGGAFRLSFSTTHPWLRLIATCTNIRARITRIPYGDQAIFIRREIYRNLGGFLNLPIMEDVEFMTRVRRAKYRTVLLSGKVLTSARRWERDGYLVRTLKNRLIITLYHLGISPNVLARFYR